MHKQGRVFDLPKILSPLYRLKQTRPFSDTLPEKVLGYTGTSWKFDRKVETWKKRKAAENKASLEQFSTLSRVQGKSPQ